MTHKPFEKQIADKLNHYEVQPGEEMLQSIFEKRAARRKPVLNLAKVFLAASVITVAIYALYNNDKNTVDTVASGAETTSGQPEIRQDKSAAVTLSGDTELKSSVNKDNRNEKERTLVARESRNKYTGGARTAFASKHDAGSTRNNHSARPDQHQNKTTDFGYTDNGADIFNRYFNVDAANRPVIASSRHKGNSHLYVYHSVSEEFVDARMFNYTPFNPLKKFQYAYELQNYEKVAGVKAERPTISRPERKPLFIDVLYTPVLTSARATDNSNLETYVNSIAGNSYSAQYGIRITKPVSSRIGVFTGLSYSDQACLYKGIVTRPEETTIINTIVTYINDPVNGSIKMTTYDTFTGLMDKQTAYNYRNSYKMFQLPLGLSYNFGYRKFNFALNGSALVNMTSVSSGQFMDMNNHTTREFSSSGKYMGLGGGLSFMSALQVSPRFRFIFEPGVQYFKINSLKAGNNVNENILNKQLSIGLRYTVF